MKPEAQRIAIAEACGWRYGEVKPSKWFPDGGHGWLSPKGALDTRPDYLNDLNAIIAVVREKIEGDIEIEKVFVERLQRIVLRRPFSGIRRLYGWEFEILTCSAAEYCEAALVALGKWVEDEAATGREGERA